MNDTGIIIDALVKICSELRKAEAELRDTKLQLNRCSDVCGERNRELLEVLDALKLLVDEHCDYAKINNLGDPEQQHNIKIARRLMIKFGMQGVPE